MAKDVHFIVVSELGNLNVDHPLVHESMIDTDLLKRWPYPIDDFPCYFYITDEHKKKIISSLVTIPDNCYLGTRKYRWSWSGSLFTDPQYRGKGLATLLVREQLRVLHERDYAWGVVFSTNTALHIYRKLDYTFPGFARRYMFMKTLRPFLSAYIKSKSLVNILNLFYQIIMKIILSMLSNQLRLDEEIVIERIDYDDINSLKNYGEVFFGSKYHFEADWRVLFWKMNNHRNDNLYIVKNKYTNAPLFYLIMRDRKLADPFAGKFIDFKLMTLMDYAFFSDDSKMYKILLKAIYSLFIGSDSDVLEIISSSNQLGSYAKRLGMIAAGKGMSFTFSLPDACDIDRNSTQIHNWHLTHYNGDAFTFG